MSSSIFRRPLAEEDLIDIWLYTYENWNEDQANLYLNTLENAFKLIAESPLICREREEFFPPVRIHPCAQHLIVYQEEKADSKEPHCQQFRGAMTPKFVVLWAR